MSNEIPESMPLVAQPYCIWHPNLAVEETYWEQLSRIYPSMLYQVGRACAVAGYDTLYAELFLRLDVLIAEEAQESMTGGIGTSNIFPQIIKSSVRYSIMNDHNRSIHIDAPESPIFLNGATRVLRQLEIRNVLGLCNNTILGPWWTGEIEIKAMILEKGEVSRIKSAINARRILKNDISTVSNDMDSAEILSYLAVFAAKE
ncbi:uncharacterized protein RSE6_13586 [Rhynchosporium secalis]|uniref:Uncharacterized protein n=1 Tax=Rhynchosporium secalis TaxID=38038 RepID=A0A1E1MT78_RHYSE|nr:uncharacterized protein RSE6_13586 [Rhynchosporium secalis]